MPTTVFTIGHGTAAFSLVAGILTAHGVASIVDVRSLPYSRRTPEFSRTDLESLAAASGFGYRWMGDALGGRPADPSLQAADGSPDWEAIRRSARFGAALTDLMALAAGAPVALLCAEESPEHCHRSGLLAPALQERGARVVHLRHDGSASAHQGSLGL